MRQGTVVTSARLNNLIARIYAAPGDNDVWQRLSGQVAQQLGADNAHFVAMTHAGRPQAHFVTLADAGQEYVDHYSAHDLAMQRVLRLPDNQVATQLDLMSQDELRTCPVQQELLPRYDGEHRMWTKSRMTAELTYSTAIIRAPRQGSFDASARNLMALLHPHLQQAMRLHLEICRTRQLAGSLQAGLEAAGTGVIIFDGTGRVSFCNDAARAILAARQGLGLAADRLMATARAHSPLEALVATALRQPGQTAGSSVTLDGEDGKPVLVRVMPLPPLLQGMLHGSGGAMVLLNDTARAVKLDPGLLQPFGLTPSETRLAVALAEGATIKQYAQEAGLSPSTVRSTLKEVFAKTRTRRQSEFVSLALRFARPSP